MEKFKKAFRRLPDPRADNARHELLEVLFIALAATLCGAEGPSELATFGQSKEGLLRLVLQLQHGVPSHDTFSRVFRLLDPQAFEAAFRRFMAGFAKANGLELRGVVAVDGKALRGAFEGGGPAKHPAAQWSTSGQRRRECAWLSAKLPAATRQRGRWKSWACWTSKAVSLPRMHCTAIATLPPRCSSGVRITCWRSRRTRASCRCGRSALCAQRSPQRCRTARTRHSRSLRVAARDRPARYPTFAAVQKFPGVVALARITSRRRVLGACAEPPQVRYFLLSKYIPAKQLLRIVRSHWDREPAALGTRCRLQRGSQPNSQRQRAREPCYPPKARPQSGPQSPRGHVPAPENQTRGVGRRLPLGHARSYAIALPTRGRGTHRMRSNCFASSRTGYASLRFATIPLQRGCA